MCIGLALRRGLLLLALHVFGGMSIARARDPRAPKPRPLILQNTPASLGLPAPDIAAAAAYERKAQVCDLGIICQVPTFMAVR